ncbi:MAG: hypothetical protein LBU77_04340 [Clostridiales bacterium]|jgi:cell division protein FtsI/penicillin-binding protein 2|nr:hypothetical protein [Clostridiales bacterium]
METGSKEFMKNVVRFLTNRLFILLVFICVLLYVTVAKLFEIQIVNGAAYAVQAQKATTQKTIDILAPRGEIYDRYGRPLAVNRIAFTVKIDPSENRQLDPEMTHAFIKIMEKNGEALIDDFPVSPEEPYTFLFTADSTKEWWLKGMELAETKEEIKEITPEEAFAALREKFALAPTLSAGEARKILSVISAVYLQRYHLNPVTMATHVKETTVAAIEERKMDFPGVYIDIDYLREYPAGEAFSHMLGYTRGISEEEYLAKKDEGYTPTSIVGQTGLEKAFESELRGKDGEMVVESDNAGIRVSSAQVQEPEQGNNVILTIDAELQKKSTALLQEWITRTLLNKLRGLSAKEAPITAKELLIAIIDTNNVFVDDIMEGKPGAYSAEIRAFIEANAPFKKTDMKYADDAQLKQYKEDLKDFLAENIDSNAIEIRTVTLSLYEQGRITLDEIQLGRLERNNSYVAAILIEKVESGEITPQMTNLDPSSGSYMVVDIHTGGILAAGSYPMYDNNELVNVFNNAYYNGLMNDKTAPMTYRAFMEPRAPGSTFKPLTAVAALEEGVITPNTVVTDLGEYREAGWPYLKCWIRGYPYHGPINVTQALEVSCNYFFNEASYRLGNAKTGTTAEGIGKLNHYMTLFGLGERSGAEVTELYDFSVYTSMPPDILKISSPGLKKYNEQARDPEKTDAQVRWMDGDTIQTSIGQSYNTYTVANMVKYIATLANGGDRYQLHFLNRVESGGEPVRAFQPKIEQHIDIAPENLKAIYDGMLAVTKGNRGTAKGVFEDFPIRIGSKTGTAEQVIDHASFTAFAPFDDPQIAVYVLIPNGGTLTTTAPAAQLARDIMSVYFGLENQPEKTQMNNTLSR